MPQKLLLIFCNLLIVTLFIAGSCNKQPLLPPYLPQYENIGGYVIGGETCNADTSKNYWLLNFTVYQNSPQIGDTITLHGSTYTNVLKVKGLDANLKKVGTKVSINYNAISPYKVTTAGCNVGFPIVYSLKEMFIINQWEIK